MTPPPQCREVGGVSLPYLSHFFDLGASFADQGAALAGWDHQPQGYWGFTGGWTVAHGVDDVLRTGRQDKTGRERRGPGPARARWVTAR